MRNDRHYEICKAIANYLKLRYPKVIYHFDYAGLNLSKAQAGKMKSIQCGRGWPDLFIAEPRNYYHGLALEIKLENEKLYKKDGVTPISEHIEEQINILHQLYLRDYVTDFAMGTIEAIKSIDEYLSIKD